MTPVCAFDANVSEWQIMRVTAWILSEMIFEDLLTDEVKRKKMFEVTFV
jgi:hypothetical protein